MEYYLNTPLDERTVRALKIGDIVYLTGVIVTMRDKAHSRVVEFQRRGIPLPVSIYSGVIYHCGPVVKKIDGGWEVVSCGPTTSHRMEEYESELISKYNIRMIIGKGGMGERTTETLNKIGAVYASFTGGAGVLAAQKIIGVEGVYWLELGVPEAIWCLKVKDFGPLIVTIDSNKNNIYNRIQRKALRKLRELT
ncbi:MAG: FumA C-terminus/TtdB family hydratase beta subunit [Candidatus Odinarchaeum yellowstonii]|uniref:FumA C-terminus/TtdB family hydratase beta subunit n=1 Tax=Odinarchaeota yellowstonii (strain LCB_4) TaxID=1841599 RepID=A0AAF0D335_ODILC|nr:MAG: FumA C-terminus/TtdB family hydratase beta subunit [Candidatus Odinarchaeum yellowstonii]